MRQITSSSLFGYFGFTFIFGVLCNFFDCTKVILLAVRCVFLSAYDVLGSHRVSLARIMHCGGRGLCHLGVEWRIRNDSTLRFGFGHRGPLLGGFLRFHGLLLCRLRGYHHLHCLGLGCRYRLLCFFLLRAASSSAAMASAAVSSGRCSIVSLSAKALAAAASASLTEFQV